MSRSIWFADLYITFRVGRVLLVFSIEGLILDNCQRPYVLLSGQVGGSALPLDVLH